MLWAEGKLLSASRPTLDKYPGLADWWRRAEALWDQFKGKTDRDLAEQANYHGKLASQFPTTSQRLIYTKAGNRLYAARLEDNSGVIDHKLYWGTVSE